MVQRQVLFGNGNRQPNFSSQWRRSWYYVGKEMAIKKLTEAGFKDIEVKGIEGDIINYYYLSRKS